MAYPLLDSNIGNQIIINHKLVNIHDCLVDNLETPSDELVFYEVIRCMNRTLLFFEDHMDRLRNSLNGSLEFNAEQIYEDTMQLLESLGMYDGNIKIVLTRNILLIYQNRHYYPSLEQYSKGVAVGLLAWERDDPNVKAVREDYKRVVGEKLSESGLFGPYFETLLHGRDGHITEGSRSNVFFVCGNEVFTAPDELILLGITRKYVLEAIRQAGGVLTTRMFSADDLHDGVDAVFITGTSIGVLPVSSMENITFLSAVNPLVKRIAQAYSAIVDRYVESHRKNKGQVNG